MSKSLILDESKPIHIPILKSITNPVDLILNTSSNTHKDPNTKAISVLLNNSVAVDRGGVRSREGGQGVTQATGHHRSYWFVVSLVLQSLSHSHTKLQVSPVSLYHVPPALTWAYTAYVSMFVCGLLCASACVGGGPNMYHVFGTGFPSGGYFVSEEILQVRIIRAAGRHFLNSKI